MLMIAGCRSLLSWRWIICFLEYLITLVMGKNTHDTWTNGVTTYGKARSSNKTSEMLTRGSTLLVGFKWMDEGIQAHQPNRCNAQICDTWHDPEASSIMSTYPKSL